MFRQGGQTSNDGIFKVSGAQEALIAYRDQQHVAKEREGAKGAASLGACVSTLSHAILSCVGRQKTRSDRRQLALGAIKWLSVE